MVFSFYDDKKFTSYNLSKIITTELNHRSRRTGMLGPNPESQKNRKPEGQNNDHKAEKNKKKPKEEKLNIWAKQGLIINCRNHSANLDVLMLIYYVWCSTVTVERISSYKLVNIQTKKTTH